MLLEKLFQFQKQQVNYFFDELDIAKAEKVLKILSECSGVIIFSGVGKSGLIAKKIAVTMTSTGTRAIFLSPSDALHGDIGIVTSKDVFVALSKSGESDELLHIVPYVRNKGAQIVAIVCDPKSRLAKACDLSITLPMEKELCPFNLVPTTSTSIQVAFGDVLAIALMNLKGFSIEQYSLNHPAGRIGKRITLRVKDLMISDQGIPLCHPEDKLVDTLVELSNKRCGCVVIVDKNRELLGIFTDGDLRRSLQRYGNACLTSSMKTLMTPKGRSIDPEILVVEAIRLMEADQQHPITVLPVVKDQRVVGIIKMHDIMQSGV